MIKPVTCMIRNSIDSFKVKAKPNMCGNEVPHEVQERFIYSGYRHVESGFLETVTSLWRSHNETINIWSHVLALFYFIYYFYDPQLQAAISVIPADERLPLYIYFLGVCILFIASSGAHLLNSISMTWRNVCFMIDYSAISVYGSFAAIYYFYYHNTRIIDVIRYNGTIFLVCVLITAISATWASCHTRLYHTPFCHHIRTSAFTMPFIIGNFPIIIRFVSHIYNHYDTFLTAQSLISLVTYSDRGWYWKDSADVVTSTTQQMTPHFITEDEFFRGYIRHLIYLIAAAIVNVIKVPERWYPGCFDILAHSHQWFHLLIFLGIREQFWLVIHDLEAQFSDPLRHEVLLQGAPSLFWLAILYKVLIVILVVILTLYGRAIHNKEKAKLK